MGRRIVTTQFQASDDAVSRIDTYSARLIKYIPADVVAAWVAAKGIIDSASGIPRSTVLWLAFAIGVVFSFLWMFKTTQESGKPPAWTQILVATGSFIVWVIATGGPFETLPFYHPVYGSLLLIAYTLGVALIVPPES